MNVVTYSDGVTIKGIVFCCAGCSRAFFDSYIFIQEANDAERNQFGSTLLVCSRRAKHESTKLQTVMQKHCSSCGAKHVVEMEESDELYEGCETDIGRDTGDEEDIPF